MIEKRICSLPSLRVSETMERDLMRAAAAEDRTLSDLMRHVFAAYLYGHASIVKQQSQDRNAGRAEHCDAPACERFE